MPFSWKCVASLFAGLAVSYASLAQNTAPALDRRCGTPMRVAAETPKSALRTATCPDSTLMRIPVVVHVIHNGEPVGIGANVDMQRVVEQINILNQDFRRIANTPGANSNPVSRDAFIQFELAAVDPLGQPTTGIVRVNGNRPGWTFNDDLAIKTTSSWPSEDYLNLWVCNLTDYLGYAQWPVSTLPGLNQPDKGAQTDGVVISYKNFGNTPAALGGAYNAGRTATHEIGHFLGLIHIWGDGDCTATDHCADTPPQNQELYGCPAFSYSCQAQGTGPDQKENYMNFTNDNCMNLFTSCQVGRMRDVLCNAPRRASLVNNNRLPTSNKPWAEAPWELQMGPNPVFNGDDLVLQFTDTAPQRVEIWNLLGQRVFEVQVRASATTLRVETSKWASSGIYLVRAFYSDKQTITRRLLVQ